MKKEVVAMLLAGGQGSRLYALTSHVAKPAVPFGGKYRIVDFPLSNCVNSGIDTVGVLTQYKPLELNRYIGSGQPWDLDRSDGGVHILPPYVVEGDIGSWYKGTANAIYQNIGFVDSYDPEYVVILSGDHIYKMDYSEMVDLHKKSDAACTIAVLEVTVEEASRFGIMSVDDSDNITAFEEKPKVPKSTLASMGIYVFSWSKLREYLINDEADTTSSNDFGKNIIPAMLSNKEVMKAYRFDGYWKDVGTITSLWDANMDVLAPEVSNINLYDDSWPIYARSAVRPPHFIGDTGHLSHCLASGGCEIYGNCENSVLFHSVTVEEGADIQYSILMPGATVKKGAKIYYSIIAENATVEENAVVGSIPDGSENWGIATVAGDVTIGAGATVAPNAMIRENVKGGEQA